MVKNPPVTQEVQETLVHPWVEKIPWRKAWHPTPVFLPEESLGQRSLVGYSHRVAKSQTQLKQPSTHAPVCSRLNVPKKICSRDFSGSKMVKNLPSNAGDMSLIPVGELRSHVQQSN